jgi:hypothetical protein
MVSEIPNSYSETFLPLKWARNILKCSSTAGFSFSLWVCRIFPKRQATSMSAHYCCAKVGTEVTVGTLFWAGMVSDRNSERMIHVMLKWCEKNTFGISVYFTACTSPMLLTQIVVNRVVLSIFWTVCLALISWLGKFTVNTEACSSVQFWLGNLLAVW